MCRDLLFQCVVLLTQCVVLTTELSEEVFYLLVIGIPALVVLIAVVVAVVLLSTKRKSDTIPLSSSFDCRAVSNDSFLWRCRSPQLSLPSAERFSLSAIAQRCDSRHESF